MKAARAKGTRAKERVNPVITRVTQAVVYAYFGVVTVLSRVRIVTLFARKRASLHLTSILSLPLRRFTATESFSIPTKILNSTVLLTPDIAPPDKTIYFQSSNS